MDRFRPTATGKGAAKVTCDAESERVHERTCDVASVDAKSETLEVSEGECLLMALHLPCLGCDASSH